MSVTIWFDPVCPFTWRTSRWLRSQARAHEESVRWRLMSLAVLNEGQEGIPEKFREAHRTGARMLRVLAAAAEHGGDDAVDALYTALGERVHDQGRPFDAETLQDALTAAGLPSELASAEADAGRDAAVRASHQEGQERVGQESGSPVVAFGDSRGFFGPILADQPSEEEAQKLYDSVATLATVSAFSELKRARG